MKKVGLIKLLVGLTLAASGAFVVGSALSNKKAEVADAVDSLSSFSKVYRFTSPASYWGDTCYVHAWGSSTTANNTEWPGINITSNSSYNESDRKMFVFATNVTDYQYLIFHNNSGYQTENITISSNTAWYLDNGDDHHASSWSPSNVTYYFYDFANAFNGSPTCKGQQSGGGLDSGSYLAMTKVNYTSNIYSISLDSAFDKFEIKNGATTTGVQWINKNRAHSYCWNVKGDTYWSDDNLWVKAHDWVYNTMHIRDIASTNNSDTGACKGANGYYNKAKSAFNNLNFSSKLSYVDEYAAAQSRFSAWATANEETATWNGTNLSISNAKISILPSTNIENTNTIAIIVIISLVSVTAIGGYFFIKKRQEN